jgi:iron complex transport system substrate-binding protein
VGRAADRRDRLGFRADRDRRRQRTCCHLRAGAAAKDRIVTPDAIAATRPDVILASWCGKKVVPDRIRSRPGWDQIPAVAANRIFEIKSPLILQPGPAALTEGLDAILAALEYP